MKFLIVSLVALSLNVFAGVDLAKSEFKWTGKKVAGPHWGMVALQSGTVVEKDGKLTGGEFVMDMNKMSVSDLQGEWADKLIAHLKSSDFFDTANHGTAKLVVKSVAGTKVKADLTIKNITKPVEFDIKKEGNSYTGTLVFDRTNYDIKYNSKNFFDVKALGDKLIDNNVSVEFKVVQN